VSVIDFSSLRKEVASRYPLHSGSIHGPEHWTRVDLFGRTVAEHSGADLLVVRLFALFHDSQRTNEGHDPGHGARGAHLAQSMRGEWFDLADDQMNLLIEACNDHTDGRVHDHPTIGTCWDADRLDLYRVGIIPNPALMSTEHARRPDVIEWAMTRA
jgi:uncharacterized protein